MLQLIILYAVIHAAFAIYRARQERVKAKKDWEEFEEEVKKLPKKF